MARRGSAIVHGSQRAQRKIVGTESQHPQQGHHEAGLGIGRQRQVTHTMDGDLIPDLHIGRIHLCRQHMRLALAHLGQRHPLQLGGHGHQDLGMSHIAGRQAVGLLHHGSGIAGGQQRQQFGRQVFINRAEHLLHRGLLHLPRAQRDGLVEQRQTVAHAAAGGLADQLQTPLLIGNVFGLQHVGQVSGHGGRADVAQTELHAARQHGDWHLLRISGGQHEDDVGWRLFQRLQHGVEGVGGEHVDLVDDEDLVAAHRGQVGSVFQHHRHFLDLAVGGRVHLQIVGKAPLVHAPAGRAFAAGMGAHALFAVQGLGQDAGDGGLAHAPGTGEQVGVVKPLVVECVAQRAHDRVLSDQGIEVARAPFAGQHLMAAGGRK